MANKRPKLVQVLVHSNDCTRDKYLPRDVVDTMVNNGELWWDVTNNMPCVPPPRMRRTHEQ
jgi:hypothetical protein